ncbi:DUF4272 domain-containing protein [Sphingomonas sanxanigenens]|uniref:DUF4272 domain-containing protein n=1 Tax=Sphingomonas sanxanigenens DSM 19645 = NX02 TaxID=1123269 RepID=W0ADC9_9SPHN|nr:DUF4272 domain-containing protein [Sphingomonas sanxanigenens]AHE54532.1 hypothetical protein NX02_14225 [Sphingomonas sanxanigenens DSM 19645 = NX02]
MGLFKSLFGNASPNQDSSTSHTDLALAERLPAGPINAYATVADAPPPDFPHRPFGMRDRSDPELLPHLQGFGGYVFNPAQRQPRQSEWALLNHALRTQRHFSFEIDVTAVPALAGWARRTNAILFLADGTVRDPDLRTLFDPAGGDEDGRLPYPADAEARRQRSRASAKAQFGLRSPDSLPPVIGAGEVVFRPAAEVAARASALMAVAVRAEGQNEGDPLPPALILGRIPLAESALSPGERAFLFDDAPEGQAVANALWRYEALTALLWALGEIDALPALSGICDVPHVAGLMVQRGAALATDAKLRDPAEILDALDLTFRLHWSLVDARQKETDIPGLVPGVIAERHHAFNWLVRYHDAAWDDVQTPT